MEYLSLPAGAFSFCILPDGEEICLLKGKKKKTAAAALQMIPSLALITKGMELAITVFNLV